MRAKLIFQGAHSDNERIAEESLQEMTRFLWEVVLEIGAAQE